MNDIGGNKTNSSVNQPELSRASLADLPQVRVMDENGEFRDAEITGERPLTIYVDKNEIVTLMTLGSHPELLTLGYLFNQRFINELNHGTVNIWEVPGYRIEMSPFGGIKDSGLGYKEGVIEAMKSFTNVKTFSLPWQ